MRELWIVTAMAAGLAAAPAAEAGLLFTVDVGGSSVSLTDQAGGGAVCFFTNCGIEVALALDPLAPPSFDLDTGDVAAFDFLTFTADGTTGVIPRIFDITATLAFVSPPGADTTGNGGGFGFFLGGFITAGNLTWSNVPQEILLADGSTISVDFQGGTGILLGHSFTTRASVTGINIVPEPAGLVLLGSGLLALGVGLRRRRRP
jgi:hypothetical protein